MFTEIILGCLVLLVVYYFIFEKVPDGMPPGMYGWPIFGQLPSRSISLNRNIEKYIKKYGKIFTWRLGTDTFVFLNDYNLVKEAYNNPLISSRPPVFSLQYFTDFREAGIIINSGTSWSNARRFTLRYLRDNGMGKSSLESYINFEAESLVNDFKKHVETPTEIPWSVNIAVLNILWRIVADLRYEVESKEAQDFQRSLTEIVQILQSPYFFIFNYLPWLPNLIPEFLKNNLVFKDAFTKMEIFRNFFRKVIKERKIALNEDEHKDLIDAFLTEVKLNEQGKGSEKTNTFTEMELLYTLSDLFVAGSETTSSSIKWIIVYMAKHQEIQRKVQKEIDNVVSRDRLPNLSDRVTLPFLDSVIHEVMRHKTLIPLGVFHCASQETTIGKYRIPKGTIVASNIAGCHFDADYWEKPTEFIPERFILPDGSFNNKKESLIPFSLGKRVCLGESLARMELYLFAGALLQNFSFELEDKNFNIIPGPSGDLISVVDPVNIIIRERE